MPAPPKVHRGDAITQVQMDALALRARQKIGKQYYIFPQAVWQVPDREHLLKFDLADWGEDPGGIVVVKDERKVYQLHPVGTKSWETFDNWVLLNWRFVDGVYGGIFEQPPYQDNLRTLANIGINGIAVVVAPWPRNHASIPPLGGIQSPEVWQYIGPGAAGSLENWRQLGGAQEVGGGFVPGTGGNTIYRLGKPIWTAELRKIQSDAIAKISNAGGRARRQYIYGQTRLSFAGAIQGFPVGLGERVLFLNQLGAPNEFPAAMRLPLNVNQVRMFKDLYYYARDPGAEIEVVVSALGPIPNEGGNNSANWLNPPYGLPAGVHFNFRILNPPINTTSRKLRGILSVGGGTGSTIGTWTDTSGVGAVETLLDRQGRPASNGRIIFGPPPQFPGGQIDMNLPGVSWDGGDFLVSWQSDMDASVAQYELTWKLRVPVNELVTRSAHKTYPVYRCRLPEIALEVVGYETQPGFPLEIGSVYYKPVAGDVAGAYIAKPYASQGFHQRLGTTPGSFELKYPFGTFSQGTNFWSLVPYPCFKFAAGQVPGFARWSIGEDVAGNATLYDVCVTRLSPNPLKLDYSSLGTAVVQIGIKKANAFVRLFDVTIPAGQGVGHATADVLQDVVIMDNEPLFYQGEGVSCVQVLALSRKPGPGVAGSNWDFQGAQFGFSEYYNETVDLLESL